MTGRTLRWCAIAGAAASIGTVIACGSYEPIAFDGSLSPHLIGFVRRDGSKICVTLAGRLFARLMGEQPGYTGAVWGESRLDLRDAPERLTNVLTGETVSMNGGLQLGQVLADLPAAVLFGQS